MRFVSTNFQSALIQFTSQTLISFVILTPIYLRNWTTGEYKTWLLLIIVFQILEIFDLGIIVGTVNRLSKAVGKSLKAAENCIKETSKALICIDLYLGSILALIITLFLVFTSKSNLILVSTVLLVNSVVNHWFGLILNISRVVDDQRKSFVFAGMYTFFQSCGWAIGAYMHKSLLFSSLIGLSICITLMICSIIFLITHEYRLKIFQGIRSIPKFYSLIQSIKVANLSYLFNTLISLASVHGYAIVVSFLVKSSIFISYSLLKTISRILISSSIALGNGYWISFAKIRDSDSSIKLMAKNLIKVTAFIIGFETLIIVLFVRIFFEEWTGNKIDLNMPMLLLLMIYSVIGAFAYTFKYIFFGIDEEKFIVKTTFLTLLFGLLLSVYLGFLFGISGIIWGQISSELILLIILIFRFHKAFIKGPIN